MMPVSPEAVPARERAPQAQPPASAAPAQRANGARPQAARSPADPDRARPGSRVPETERERKVLARMRKRWADEKLWELAKRQDSDRLRSALRHIKGLRVVDDCVYVLFGSEEDSELARASKWFHEKMRDYAGDHTDLACQHGDEIMIRRPRSGWDGSATSAASAIKALQEFMVDKLGATELDQREVGALLARMQEPQHSG